jgi:hypothetical protein
VNVSLYDAQVSTCLVDAVEVRFFIIPKGFKMEQTAPIKFCAELKKTANEMSEMLNSMYSKECLSTTNVFEWHKRFEGRLRKWKSKN